MLGERARDGLLLALVGVVLKTADERGDDCGRSLRRGLRIDTELRCELGKRKLSEDLLDG